MIRQLWARIREDAHFADVLVTGVKALGVKCLSAVATFGFAVLMARLVGAEAAGVYFLSLAIINIVAIVGFLGQDRTALRFVSIELAKENWSAIKGILRHSFTMVGWLSVFLAAAIWFAAPYLAITVFDNPNVALSLRIMCFALPAFGLAFVGAEILKALKQISSGVMVQSLLTPLFGSIFVIGAVKQFGVMGPQISFVTATVLTATVMSVLMRKSVGVRLRQVDGNYDLGRLISTGTPILMMTLLVNFSMTINTFVIGAYYPESEVAIYGAATRFALLLNFLLFSVNSVAAPKYAEFFENGDLTELRRLLMKTSGLLVVLSLPVCLALMLYSKFFMSVFGSEFTAGARVLQILILGQFVNVSIGSVNYVLTMTGNEKITAVIVSCSTVLCVVLSLLLVPEFGITGAAIGFVISDVLRNLALLYITIKRL